MRSTDEKLYRDKRRSIFRGSNNSIELFFNDSQRYTFRENVYKNRIKTGDKVCELKARGASLDDLMDAALGLNPPQK